MRKFGDNSDGNRNEKEIAKALNFKVYEQLNSNLKSFINDVFRGCDVKGKIIHAIQCGRNVKPDFYLKIDGIDKDVYVSVKKGCGNSIHQEAFCHFVDFLVENNFDSDSITALKYYHFSDGTDNNTGKNRIGAKEFSKQNPEIMEKLCCAFSDKRILRKLYDRFLFVGNKENAPSIDYIYHGTIHNGVWASKSELLEYFNLVEQNNQYFYIGPFTYQTWNKNLQFNPKTEPRRLEMQIKWDSMERALTEIIAKREQYRQNGTFEGDFSEKAFVIYFNKYPQNTIFKHYLSKIKKTDENNVFLVRVSQRHYSKLSEKKVMTKADAYAIEITDNRLFEILEKNDFYLDEDILSGYEDYYEIIEESGISIKLDNTTTYQIVKLWPDSFYKLFGNYELGAGASLYCQEESELVKNISVIKGWKTNIDSLQQYFDIFAISEEKIVSSSDLCRLIKTYSNAKIQSLIDNDITLQQKIFNGIDLYDEPYTARYLLQNKKIKELSYIPFFVTTGSGRSRGVYTIILKPKI